MSRILIPLLLLGVGCARVVPLRSDAEIWELNYHGGRKFSVVTLENGKTLSAHRLELRADTLRIHHLRHIPSVAYPLSDIRSIRFANRWDGAQRGIQIAAPIALGAGVVFLLVNDLFFIPDNTLEYLVAGFLWGGVTVSAMTVGGAVGGAAGLIVGAPCRYEPVADTLAVPDSLLLPGTVVP